MFADVTLITPIILSATGNLILFLCKQYWYYVTFNEICFKNLEPTGARMKLCRYIEQGTWRSDSLVTNKLWYSNDLSSTCVLAIFSVITEKEEANCVISRALFVDWIIHILTSKWKKTVFSLQISTIRTQIEAILLQKGCFRK